MALVGLKRRIGADAIDHGLGRLAFGDLLLLLLGKADDRGDIADETERLLVEGLVIRESLLELCQEIERAMVAFEARLTALQAPVLDGGA